MALHHLELVTRRENELRKSWRYRARRTKCPRGHELSSTAIITPEGRHVVEPLRDGEGLLIADCDLSALLVTRSENGMSLLQAAACGVKIAGEPERAARTARSRDGIVVDDATWAELQDAAAKVGL